MNREGPILETLLRRLAETPADFLERPYNGSSGRIHIAAVVSDLLRDLGGPPLTPDQAREFQPAPRSNLSHMRLVLIASWLLAGDWFKSEGSSRKPGELAALALAFLTEGVKELAASIAPDKFVSDPDRREELARLCLKDLGYRPLGETIAQAQDRLSTMSTVERQRVVRLARQAEERARAIRAEMARKAALDAQAKAMRE